MYIDTNSYVHKTNQY